MGRRTAGPPQPRRRVRFRWGRIALVSLVIAVLAGVGAAVWFVLGRDQSDPVQPSSTVIVGIPTGVFPNGCLGGESNSVDALLNAQKSTQQRTEDAVALAASYGRWMTQYPAPSVADGERVVEAFAAKSADQSVRNLPKQLAERKPLAGWVTGGVNYSDGRYIVEDATPSLVTVTVGGVGMKNGLPVPDYRIMGTMTLVWESDTWKIVSSSPQRSLEDLFTNGSQFAGGC